MSRLVMIVCVLLMVIVGMGQISRSADAANVAAFDTRLSGFPEVTIRIDETGITLPATIAAGRTLIIQENGGVEPEEGNSTHFFIMRLPDRVTDAQLDADLSNLVASIPDWFYEGTFVGNPDRARTGGGQTFGLVDFTPGRHIVMDPLAQPAKFTRFDVVAPAGVRNFDLNDAPAPAADITATMFEMAFGFEGTVAAGPQIWQVTNTGALPHEMAIVPVPDGATKGEVKTAFTALMQGNAIWNADLRAEWMTWSEEMVNGAGVLSAGGTVWTQFDFAPGTYAAVCFVPGAGMMPHLMDGMIQIFTVA